MSPTDEIGAERPVWATHAAAASWDLTQPPPDWVSGPEEVLGQALDQDGPLYLVLTKEELRAHKDALVLRQAYDSLFEAYQRVRVRTSVSGPGAWPSAWKADPYTELFGCWVELTLAGGTRLIGLLERPLEEPEQLLGVQVNTWDRLLVRRWVVQTVTPLPDPPEAE